MSYSCEPAKHLGIREAIGLKESIAVRRLETRDILKRLGFITPKNVELANYIVEHPQAFFNSSIVAIKDHVIVLGRIIVGYYRYVSALAETSLKLEELLSGSFTKTVLRARIVIVPENKYDFWGAEDPRLQVVEGGLYATYTGRTQNYFKDWKTLPQTLPVTAVKNSRGEWVKIAAYFNQNMRGVLVSSKNAFLAKTSNTWLFQRLHLRSKEGEECFIGVTSPVELPRVESTKRGIQLVEPREAWALIKPASFEEKVGWATLLETKKDTVLVLVHGVSREPRMYRVYALEVELGKKEAVVKAVTPTYIVEPRLLPEVYGDTPFVVFPTGAWRIEDKYIVSYGAGDIATGIGAISIEELYSALDKGRIY